MGDCEHCPGQKGLEEYLTMFRQEEDDDVDGGDVTYKQWESTDRCTLRKMVSTLDESVHYFERDASDVRFRETQAKQILR